MAADPRFATNAGRCDNVAELDAAIAAWTRTKPAAEAEAILEAADVPCSRLFDMADCANDPHFRERGWVMEVADPLLGQVLHPAPFRFDGVTPREMVRWPGPPPGRTTSSSSPPSRAATPHHSSPDFRRLFLTMTTITLAARGAAAARFWGLALLGSALLAASAQVSLPMWPVPATLQTLAVLLLARSAARGSARRASRSTSSRARWACRSSRTGRAASPCWRGRRRATWRASSPPPGSPGWRGRGLARQAAVLTAAHLVLFVPGVAWLAGFVGWERALVAGFVVFIPGTVVKTALAVALLRAARRG